MNSILESLPSIQFSLTGDICDVCGTHIITVGGSIQPCGNCAIESAKEERIKIMRDDEIKNSWKNLVDECYRTAELSSFDTKDPGADKVFRQAREWLESFAAGKWVVMYGNQGTGKTLMRNIMTKELCRKGYKLFVTNQREMFEQYTDNKFSGNRYPAEKYRKYDVLVIEEIGRVTNTEAVRNFMFEIVDDFYSSNRSLILVSNLPLAVESGRASMTDTIDRRRVMERAAIIPFMHQCYKKKK